MDPLILLKILQGVAATGAATANAIPTIRKYDLERQNEGEVAKLKHLRETGGFGLSAKEQQRIMARQMSSAENQLARDAAKAQQAMASSAATGAGQLMNAAQSQLAEGAKIKTSIQQGIEEASAQKAAQQEQEYWTRLAADSQAKKERTAAWLSIPQAALESFSGGAQIAYDNTQTKNTVAPSQDPIESLQKAVPGLSTEDATLLSTSLSPEVLAQLMGT